MGTQTMDMNQLQAALSDPQIELLTEKLAQDPEFKRLQDSLQKAYDEGNDQASDDYMKSMEKLFQNEKFMNMASEIGQQIMQQNPDIQRYAMVMNDPKMKGIVEERMAGLRKDPSLKHVFKDIDREGPMAMMKYQADPEVQKKFNEAFKDIAPPETNGPILEEEDDDDSNDFADYPLLQKAEQGDLKGVEEILSNKKENVNQSDDQDRTALHVACGFGHRDIVEFLLSKKAKIDVTDVNKSTPLHYAAGYGYLEIVELLVKKKASTKLKTEDGLTALDVARTNQQDEVVKFLQK